MPAWLGVDHGIKRIGIAVGNTEDCIACPLEVIDSGSDPGRIHARVHALVSQYDIVGVVVGWPLNMDDSEGDQGRMAREFAVTLAETENLDVRLWDERLSSFQADEYTAGRMSAGRRRACRDAMAASVILEEFLSNEGPERAPGAKENRCEN